MLTHLAERPVRRQPVSRLAPAAGIVLRLPAPRGEGPTLYPVACSPQSWASAAVFLLLQACLGLSIDASRREIRFCRPHLPESLSFLTIKNLRVGDASADLTLERYPHDVGISVSAKKAMSKSSP